jgi:Ca2+/Na+ antiporter
VIGFVVIVAGIGLIVVGVTDVVTITQRYSNPLRGNGPAAIAGGAATVFWGMFVLTMGRVVWRGARKRGAKDRFGRVLMIVAMAIMGFAVQMLVLGFSELMHTTTEGQARTTLILAYVPYLLLGIPAAIIGSIGGKMANETEELISVSAKAEF